MTTLRTIRILGQMEDTSFQVSHLWSPSGYHIMPWPDFNNGPGDNSNCGRIFGTQQLFEADLNNGPSPVLGQMRVLLFRCLTYGLLVGAMPGQGPWPDFSNGPGDNSDSGCISPPPPSVYSSLTRRMALPKPIQSWSDRRDFCSGASPMVSWWVKYLIL